MCHDLESLLTIFFPSGQNDKPKYSLSVRAKSGPIISFWSGKLPIKHFVWGSAGPTVRATQFTYCAVTTYGYSINNK